MFRHVVMFRWGDGVDAEQIAAVAAGLDGLVDAIPQIARYRHGSDVRINDGNFDYVVVADFADADGYVAYRDHPDHRRVVADLIVGRISDRAAVQYELGE